jgi:hypothetical protein
MSTTTKVIIAVAAIAAVGGAAFWAYKRHPEWFRASNAQNPNQVNPAVSSARDRTSQQIEAASTALESVSNVAAQWLQ